MSEQEAILHHSEMLRQTTKTHWGWDQLIHKDPPTTEILRGEGRSWRERMSPCRDRCNTTLQAEGYSQNNC